MCIQVKDFSGLKFYFLCSQQFFSELNCIIMEAINTANVLNMSPQELAEWVEPNIKIDGFSFQAAFAGILM